MATQIATTPDKPTQPFDATLSPTTGSQTFSILDQSACRHLWQLAVTFSKSEMVPEQFRNKPANTFVALEIAARAGLSPFGVLQNIYVIAGKPAFETKLAVALLNCSGKIRGPVIYAHEGKGTDRRCTATVIDADTGREISHTLHWKTVEDEGWITKSKSKWTTDPLLMLKYRTIMQLIRTTYPEVLLGMYSVEEAYEMKQDNMATASQAEFMMERAMGPAMIEKASETLDAQVIAETVNMCNEGAEPPDDWMQDQA